MSVGTDNDEAEVARGNRKTYDIAIIVTVEARTYDDALVQGVEIAEALNMVGDNASAVTDYEHDNEGQRVLYLHPETVDNAPYWPSED